MPILTDVRNEITKALDSAQVAKPLYAVAGAGGLAVEKVRDLHIDRRIAGLGDEARALPGKVQHVQADVQVKVRELPSTVVDAALAASDRATGLYDDLSDRGRKLVDGLGSQRAVTVTDAPAKQSANGTAAEPATSSATSTAVKSTSTKTGTAKSTKTAKSTSAKSTSTSTTSTGSKATKKS